MYTFPSEATEHAGVVGCEAAVIALKGIAGTEQKSAVTGQVKVIGKKKKKTSYIRAAASPRLLLSCRMSSSAAADSRLTLLSSSWAWICCSLCSASSLPAAASRAAAQLCSSSCCCRFRLVSSAEEDAAVNLPWTRQVNRWRFYKRDGVSCKDAHTALSAEPETYRWVQGFFWAPARACLSPRTPIWAPPGGLGRCGVTEAWQQSK